VWCPRRAASYLPRGTPSTTDSRCSERYLPQLGDAVLAAQTFQHSADRFLGGELPPCGSANVTYGLLGAVRRPVVALCCCDPSLGVGLAVLS
jgi:hypothetical protein